MDVPRNGLVLELLLDRSAADTSGAGHHGVIHGTTFTADRFGRPDAAGLFDGVDDHIAIDPPLPLNGAFTVSLWARIDTGNMHGWSNCLVAQDNGDDNDQSRRVFQLSVYNGRVVWHRMINTRDPTARRLIVPGAWFHAVAVVEESRHRLYVDGVLQDSVTHAGRRHETEPIYIGRKGTPEPCFFTRGAIDDVRVYNRALGSSEISALYRENGFVNPVDAGRLSAPPISGLWGLHDQALLDLRADERGVVTGTVMNGRPGNLAPIGRERSTERLAGSRSKAPPIVQIQARPQRSRWRARCLAADWSSAIASAISKGPSVRFASEDGSGCNGASAQSRRGPFEGSSRLPSQSIAGVAVA